MSILLDTDVLSAFAKISGLELLNELFSGEEILITNGAQQAIELIFKLLGQPGEYVAIESPTYANVIPLIRHHGLNILEIPVNDGGMNLTQLEQNIAKKKPILVYTIPNFQNPTGITTDQSASAVASCCSNRNICMTEAYHTASIINSH